MRASPVIGRAGGGLPVDVFMVAGGGCGGASSDPGFGGVTATIIASIVGIGVHAVVVGFAGGGGNGGGPSSFNFNSVAGGTQGSGNAPAGTVNNYETGSNRTYGIKGAADQSETPGGANTGNGGSSSPLGSGIFVDGGTGIVVIRYPVGLMTATGGTISTIGGFRTHVFTASGNFTRTA